MNDILKFPTPASDGAPLTRRVSHYGRLNTEFQILLCRLANWLGLPGAVADVVIDDPVTGQHVEVRRSIFFTRISINGRDYYFTRFGGKFDGTGSGCI